MAELNLLQEKILSDGVIRPGNVLKVDSFLNHQIDVPFISELGKEFKKLFGDRKVDKILTIEASGIGIACLTAVYFGVPVVLRRNLREAIWIRKCLLRRLCHIPIIGKTMWWYQRNI